MSLLSTHPRFGKPAYLAHLGFNADDSSGGGGDSGDQNPPADAPKGDPPGQDKSLQDRDPKPGDRTARSDDDKVDWVAEAKKWEKLSRDNHAKLEPLLKFAEALTGGTDDKSKADPVKTLSERFDSYEKELQTERAARWRAEVAHEKGLTSAQAARLIGNSREELVADADALLEAFKASPQNGRTAFVVPQSGTGSGEPAKGSLEAGRDLFARSRGKQAQTTP